MDTRAAKVSAADGIAIIKSHMPETYKEIQVKAKAIGNDAFVLVRRGIRGEPNCFYAFEAGHVVGTPFSEPNIRADVAMYMVQFGVSFCCIWAQGAGNGAH